MSDIELDPEPTEPFIELDPENLCDEFGPASTELLIELEPEELDLEQVCAEFGPDCQVEIELEPEEPIVPPVAGCIELDEEEFLPPAAFEDAWVPGKDVGRHIHKGVRPIQEQSQIILVNLVRTCMALPSAVLREIIDKLPPLKFSNDSSTGRYFFKAASRLCRLLLLPCQFIFIVRFVIPCHVSCCKCVLFTWVAVSTTKHWFPFSVILLASHGADQPKELVHQH